jgi:hypothetical protein
MGMNTRSGVPALGERSAVVVAADLLSDAPSASSTGSNKSTVPKALGALARRDRLRDGIR